MKLFGETLFKDAKKPMVSKRTKKRLSDKADAMLKKSAAKKKKISKKSVTKIAKKKTNVRQNAPKQKGKAVNCPICGKFYNSNQGKTCKPCSKTG